jgi:S-DNA-T family DNA segregation ATPase FtsK/SpoIIIE
MEDKKTRLIADNKEDLGDILYELSNTLRRRTEDQKDKENIPLPHYCIFIDDQELLEGEILEKTLYNPVEQYGITTFLLAEKYADLPNSCEEIIQNDKLGTRMFNVYNEEKYSSDLEIESVTTTDLERLAKRLCNIEVNETVESGEIPDSLDFFDMFGVRSLEELHVLDRWRKNRNYETMRVPIGMKNGGNICYLDIHEKYHGPHGLVAGTTGSGKSETLQTYILALAVNFSPDDIAFFIIDFKGGGMANLFTNLPHMAGQISNLSGNQVRRAMISIKSENKRRQRIFAENNVNNINLYTRLYKNHEASLPVPHLFIVIDEFAELKREEPEFMKELISVAQVGRSLGVHLILATQKPSGTVDENIWSNSKFRLCLRVQDKQDSNDMLHRSDAAYITQAGRGYLQVGNDEIFEQFQSGYSGAEYEEDPGANRSSAAELIKLNGKVMVSGGSVRKHKVSDEKSITQLDAVIDYLNKLACNSQYNKRMLLWKPVLAERVFLEDLEGYSVGLYHDGVWKETSGEFELSVPIGIYDDPANQDQKSLYVDFKEGGNLAVCGLIGTGKSTFVQSLLWSMIQHYSPEDLNFYILDYSSRMLLPFENAPHCGGVIIDTDDDKVNKFFFMIGRMIEERKSLFKGANYSQYVRANRGKRKLPAVLIVIDNCANFREKTDKVYDDLLLRLSREGIGYGIYLVLTAAGYGSSEIPTRLADNIKSVMALEMGDKFKYTELFHTTASGIQILPEANIKGRGLTSVQGRILEFHTALVCRIEDAYEQSAWIETICKEMDEKYQGVRAKKIPVIPEKPVFQDIQQMDDYRTALDGERYLPFAYLSKDASIYSVDLWTNYCYLVQGKGKTGKTNVMLLLLYAACQKANSKVYVIDDASFSMKERAEKLGATVITDPSEMFDFFNSTIPTVKERSLRKKELLAQGLETIEVAERMNENERIFIFISDVVAFVKQAGVAVDGKGKVQGYIENITEKGAYLGMYFIGCVNTDDAVTVNGNRIYQNFISYKTGVHLGGNTSSQRVFQFSNIPYQEGTKATKPGLGLVPSGEDYLKADGIVIPLVKGSFT